MDFGNFPSQRDQEQIINTQLVEAAKAGDVEQIEFCLAAGAGEKACNMALLEAVRSDFVESTEIIINLLTVNGASLHSVDLINEFSLAVTNDDVERVQLYLLAGVSEKARNIALYEAVKSGQPNSIEIICLLTKNGASLHHNSLDDFFAAIKEGNSDRVFSFMVAGIEHRYAVNRQGQTPLMVAAQHGHIELIEKFLQEGAELNAVANNNNQYTAMDYAAIYAAKTQDTQALEMFIARDAIMNHELSISSSDRYNRRDIHVPLIIWASYHGLSHIVANLLEKDSFMIGVADSAQLKTPLMWAVIQGQVATATILIDHIKHIKEFLKEADTEENLINAIDSNNYTAMDYAATRASKKQDDTEMLEMLIGCGAIMNRTMTIPRGNRHNDHRGIDVPFITWASYYGLTHIVKLLLTQDRSMIETPDAIQFKTPLLWAVSQGHTATAIELIGAGANCQVLNNDGDNLIQFAIKNNNAELVHYLLDNHYFVADEILLQAAIKSGSVDNVKAVLAAIPDVLNNKKVIDSAPLYFAVSCGHAPIVNLLLRRGFAVDQINSDTHENPGDTPLLKAISGQHLEVLDVLLKAYAHRAFINKVEIDADIERHLRLENFSRILASAGSDIAFRFLSSLPTKRVNRLGDQSNFFNLVSMFKFAMIDIRANMLTSLGIKERPILPVEKSLWEQIKESFWYVIDLIKQAFSLEKAKEEKPISLEEDAVITMPQLPKELACRVLAQTTLEQYPFWYQHRLENDLNFAWTTIENRYVERDKEKREKLKLQSKLKVESVPLPELEPRVAPVIFSPVNSEVELDAEKNQPQNNAKLDAPKLKVGQA